MKGKRVITGQRLAILFIGIALIAASIIAFAIVKLFGGKKLIQEENVEDLFAKSESSNVSEVCEKKDWGKDIIGSTTKEEVPIPRGYEYKRGNLSNGIVVRETETGSEFLWIPYQKDTSKYSVEEYYKNVDVNEVSPDTIKSINKYNGFYVSLNMNKNIDDLKELSNETYKSYAKQLEDDQNETDKHILSKEEVEQAVAYIEDKKIKLNVGIEAMTIGLYSSLNIAEDTETTVSSNNVVATKASYSTFDRTKISNQIQLATNNNSSSKSNGYYAYVSFNSGKAKVPVPSGFKYSVYNGIVTIQAKDNKNMVYIWVPATIDELNNSKEELRKLYEKYTRTDGESYSLEKGTDKYDAFNNTSEKFSDEFVKSIEKFKGFYVSEAELGNDRDGNPYNRARGMINYSASEQADGGDYYRVSNQSFKGKNLNILIEESNSEKSVVSHLMYGAEYDRMLMWLLKQKTLSEEELLENSTNIGKYKNSEIGKNATAEQSGKFLNGIWGLAGNLYEFTAESMEKDGKSSYVLRGGSYKQAGNEDPIANRRFLEDFVGEEYEDEFDNGSAIGIRTCLYIQPSGVKEGNIKDFDTFENKADYNSNNVEFNKLKEEQSLWVNDWDGIKVYSEADNTKEEIQTLPFATRITVKAKAKYKTSEDFYWAKGEANGVPVYFNCVNGVTKNVGEVLASDENGNDIIINFVSGEPVKRFTDGEIKVWGDLTEEYETVKTDVVTVDAKTVDFKYAEIKIGEKYYWVLANDLRKSKESDIENMKFNIWEETVVRYAKTWEGMTIFDKPDESSNVVGSFGYAEQVPVTGKAKEATNDNLWWAQVSLPENKIGYVNAQNLATEKGFVNVENNRRADNIEKFLKSGQAIRFFDKGLTVYSKPDYSEQAVLKVYSDEGSIKVTGKSMNGVWTSVDTDQGEGYVYSKNLKKTENEYKDNSLIYNVSTSASKNIDEYRLFIGTKDKDSIEKITVKNTENEKNEELDISKFKFDEEGKYYWITYDKLDKIGWYEVKILSKDKKEYVYNVYYNGNNHNVVISKNVIYTYETGREVEKVKVNGEEVLFKKNENGDYTIESELNQGERTIEVWCTDGSYSKKHNFIKYEKSENAAYLTFFGKTRTNQKRIRVYKEKETKKVTKITVNGEEISFKEENEYYYTDFTDIKWDTKYILEATLDDGSKIRTYYIQYSD